MAKVSRVTLACHIPAGRSRHTVALPELDSCLFSVLLHKLCLISLFQAAATPQNFIPEQHRTEKTFPKDFSETTLVPAWSHHNLRLEAAQV